MKLRVLIPSLMVLVLANVLVQHRVVRWDMTDDKRYSLSEQTKTLLQQLTDHVDVTLYLHGDLNSGFTRLRQATEELVGEMDVYARVSVRLSISEDVPQGLTPTVIHERTRKGQTAQTTVYPYASVSYKGKSSVVSLLRNNRGLSGEENLNLSVENLEFAFVEALLGLTLTKVEKIAFLEGHDELPEENVYDLSQALSRYYQIDRGTLGTETGVLDEYKVVIIADPQRPFSDEDKYILDQYLMQGGHLLWVLNGVRFSSDNLSAQGTTPVMPLDLNVTDMLFRYGVRVNSVLVQDMQCLPVPVDVSADPENPNWQPMSWTYAPLLLTSQASPITRNLMQVSATMASSLDLVGGEDGLHKEILLATSSASRITKTPAEVDLSFSEDDAADYPYSYVPVATVVEGVFSSLYAYQMPPETIMPHAATKKESVPTKQIVVAAGSVIRNEWQQGRPVPLGYDRYTRTQFGNRDFLVNAVLYLADDSGWMSLRQKEVTMRLINDQRARDQRITAQVTSMVIPLMLLALTGGIVFGVRKQRYTKQQ